jgi:hydroxymethylglutaryl-CoA lyase
MPMGIERVSIVEVGPRDGLQNEPGTVSTEDKLEFCRLLAESGIRQIEATSFVSPRWVPQLADADEVARRLPRLEGVVWSALVPNERGLDRALQAGLRRVAVFTAASETFNQKNTNRSIEQSLADFAPLVRRALAAGASVRGYVSTCFVCPYEGAIEPDRVVRVAERLVEMGVDQVSLGDTVGQAVPTEVRRTLGRLLEVLPPDRLALHLHDTCGTALANVWVGLEMGIATYDSSAGGLGGCPYAPGAAGNLATEDLVYMLERMGISTGVDLEKVVRAAAFIEQVLGRPLWSRQLRRRQPYRCPSAPSLPER